MHEILLNVFAILVDLLYYGECMRELNSDYLFNKMKFGRVYRRSDLSQITSSVDRDLNRLTEEGRVKKVGTGLYMKPKDTAFGSLPASEKSLIKSFLKDDRFLVFSFNDYNKLGLGLTQLFNNFVVYNFKRHGEFELGGQKFVFKRLPRFPKNLTREYLLVDLLNNLKNLGEEKKEVLGRLKNKKKEFAAEMVIEVSEKFGRASTKKLLKEIFEYV